jgi:hypothetical protein
MKHLFIIILIFISALLRTNANAQTAWKTFRHENGFTIQLPNDFKKGLLVAAGTLQYFDNSVNTRSR